PHQQPFAVGTQATLVDWRRSFHEIPRWTAHVGDSLALAGGEIHGRQSSAVVEINSVWFAGEMRLAAEAAFRNDARLSASHWHRNQRRFANLASELHRGMQSSIVIRAHRKH